MNIDWTSQLLAAASSLLIGAIWYGPLFGKTWLKESGLTLQRIKDGYSPILLHGIGFILAFVITIGLKGYIVDLHLAFNKDFDNNFGHGAYHALIISLIMGAIPALITNALYDQRSWKYIAINVGYWIITFSVMGGVIGMLQ